MPRKAITRDGPLPDSLDVLRECEASIAEGEPYILNKADQITLWRRARDGDKIAETALVKSLYPLAYSETLRIARKMGKGDDAEEIESTAYLAIARMLGKFDESFDCKLSTYLVWWVKAVAYRLSDGVVHIPMNLRTDADAEKSMGSATHAYRECAKKANRVKSLDAPVGYGRAPASFGALLPGECLDYGDAYDKRIEKLQMRWALCRLHPSLRRTIQLTIVEAMTLQAAGDVMGCTRERVRQLRQKGLSKLYDYMQLAPSVEADLVDLNGDPLELDGLMAADQPAPVAKPQPAPVAKPRPAPRGGPAPRKWPCSDTLAGQMFLVLRETGECLTSRELALHLPANTVCSSVSAAFAQYRDRFFIAGDRRGAYRAATNDEIEEFWQTYYPGRIPADIAEPPLAAV